VVYATQQDIVDRYSEAFLASLADRDGDGLVDTTAVTKALADASAEIDTYVGAAYELPLASTPAVLVQICVDIAVYKLGYAPGAGADDAKSERYKAALAILRDIAKGTASLGLASETASVGGAVSISGPERIFTRETMKGLS
jgi:phage gp36-like protein